MKHTLNSLSHEVEQLGKRLGDVKGGELELLRSDLQEMKNQMDLMKQAMHEFLLTTNSAYKKQKAVAELGDFLGKRFGR